MTYFPDLSRYQFLPETVRDGVIALNVGWLDENHDVPTGKARETFVANLFWLCKEYPVARTRGYHPCVFCRQLGVQEYPSTASYEGESIPLGSAEVRVVADDGTWLVAPDLVLHYVQCHEYRPPEAFVAAVERRQLPDATS